MTQYRGEDIRSLFLETAFGSGHFTRRLPPLQRNLDPFYLGQQFLSGDLIARALTPLDGLARRDPKERLDCLPAILKGELLWPRRSAILLPQESGQTLRLARPAQIFRRLKLANLPNLLLADPVPVGERDKLFGPLAFQRRDRLTGIGFGQLVGRIEHPPADLRQVDQSPIAALFRRRWTYQVI